MARDHEAKIAFMREYNNRPEVKARNKVRKSTPEVKAKHASLEREARKNGHRPYDPVGRAKWRDKNRERIRDRAREYARKYRKRDRDAGVSSWSATDKGRAYLRKYQRDKWEADPHGWMVHRTKTRAKMHGFEFSITVDDVVWATHCPILGVELEYGPPSDPEAKRHNRATLDRKDSSKGYVPGNVYAISFRANCLKDDATVEEMEAVLRYMRGDV